MSLQSVLFFTLIVFARYLLVGGSFYILCWVWKKDAWESKRLFVEPPSRKYLLYEFKWSIVTCFIFGALSAWLNEAWLSGKTLVYLDLSRYGVVYAVFSLFLMLFIHDTYFYWMHRWLHTPWAFKKIHYVHHHSKNPSPWAAFSFHPVESVLESLYMPMILFLIPAHPIVILIFMLIMSVLGVVNHLGYELYPKSYFENRILKTLISATNHQTHHRLNNFNFGLYFTWWDMWMGTEYRNKKMSLPVATNEVVHSR